MLSHFTIRKVFFCIAIIYYGLYLTHSFFLGKTVYGDGIYYYSWLKSIVIDHDILFNNDFNLFHVSQARLNTGYLSNIYSIGPMVFWFPIYSLIHSIFYGNGHELSYQLSTGFLSVSYALIGLFVLFQILNKLFIRNIALISILATALCSNLLFYGSLDPVNSHAISFFLSTTYLYYLLSENKNVNAYVIGLFIGLLALIRIQDVVLIILSIPFLTYKKIPKVIIGFMNIMIFQFIVWGILYGKLVIPYTTLGLRFHFFHPQLINVLFSSNNSLFYYSPVLILALIGLFIPNPPIYLRSWVIVLAFLLQLYIVGSWEIWWQGASYSGRMFISLLPVLTIGIAKFLNYLNIKGVSFKFLILGIVIPFSLTNCFMIIKYLSSF